MGKTDAYLGIEKKKTLKSHAIFGWCRLSTVITL